MATTAPGLGSIAISEISAKLPGAWIQNQMRGRILFNTDAPWGQIQELKCVDNLYLHIAWLKIGPHRNHLGDLTDDFESISLLDLPFLRRARPGSKVIINASRSGKHTFSRFEAAKAAMKGLAKAYKFTPGTVDDHEFNFRLDIVDQDALFSLKLTDSTFRFRGQRDFSKGALRPPIAHALIWLSNPKPEDTFLDPFCGSGTIVAERSLYTAQSIIGSDLSKNIVAIAKANVPDNVEIVQMDACSLTDIADESINSIVSNPPWGKQVAQGEDIGKLYMQFFQEMNRVLTKGGSAVLLTDRKSAIQAAAESTNLQCQELYTISLHGLLPVVYQIWKT